MAARATSSGGLFYFSTMTAGIKRETFPFKRSFSIIKCFSRRGVPTSLQSPSCRLLLRFSTGETNRGENLLPHPSVRPSFFFVYPRYASSLPPTYRGSPVTTESLLASGYRDTSREKLTRNDPTNHRSFLRSPLVVSFQTMVSFLPCFLYIYPDDASPSLPAMSQRMSRSGISRRAANDVTSTRDTRRYRTWRIFVMDQGIVYGLET